VLRGLLLVLSLSANPAFSGTVQTLPALPNAAAASAVQVDPSGNIYVAGSFLSSPTVGHAFAAKLSPDGSQVIWWTVLAGSQNDGVAALALGADNSVYVTGSTFSTDFPTTPGSMQPNSSVSGQKGFVAKLSPNGAVLYATYIGGSATQTNGAAIAVHSSGAAFITGGTYGSFPTSPGAVKGGTSLDNTTFVIELNPAGSAAPVAITGFGGSAIAVDLQGNIYAAGAGSILFPPTPTPTTPGAFQPTAPPFSFCYTSINFQLPCPAQHIAKIDPTGTKLIYATYLGSATPSAMAVDQEGNAIVAGSTSAMDYPTTPAAYQPEYFASPVQNYIPYIWEAPVSGYVTKLNAAGSGLIWSTLFGGSHDDHVTGLAIGASGNILLAGHAYSSDLPGLWLTPVSSRPTVANPLNFVARLSPDGSTLSPTELLPYSTAAGVAVRSDGIAVAASPLALVRFSTIGRVAAITDSADNARIVSVAPGQLLTLLGTNLAPPDPAYPPNGFPASFSGVTVTFNGIPAPLLYTSGTQINLQLPYEIAGLTQVSMQVSSQFVSPPVSESYFLAVVERQPSVFLSASAFSQPFFDISQCNGQNISGLQPLALNADGTQNSCANPAVSGSNVTIFVNGLGVTTPAQSTGAVSSSAVAITPAVGTGTNVLSTTTLPGSIDGIAQVQLQVSSTKSNAFQVGTFLVRGPGILIWVQPGN
jgi:uncharacterized protein (TIGR03437 family)